MTLLLDRLRLETQPLHEQTEQLFYTGPLRDGTLSLDEYGHLLRTHLNFHQALETAIDTYPAFFRDYAPQTRRKTPWLLADLTHLNESLPPPTPTLFANWSAIDLLGAIYVSEGSMLGGIVINKLLQQNPAIRPLLLTVARFYQGYGPETGNYWRRCGAFITQQGTPCADAVVAAAKRAFTEYQQAFYAASVPSGLSGIDRDR